MLLISRARWRLQVAQMLQQAALPAGGPSPLQARQHAARVGGGGRVPQSRSSSATAGRPVRPPAPGGWRLSPSSTLSPSRRQMVEGQCATSLDPPAAKARDVRRLNIAGASALLQARVDLAFPAGAL